jgi:cytosine/adenosine deaminase-related metal-dependent hydrolase
LEEKFEITKKNRIITAIQKNLSHYEISPHPDIREKALTYLLNINKDNSVDDLPIHTHLLEFKEEWEFIKEHWATDFSQNTTWVPWDWCESIVRTNKNNSIVIFKPSTDTLHAVKMKYDHTKFQRTQLYGNLMGLEDIVSPANYRELIQLRQQREGE